MTSEQVKMKKKEFLKKWKKNNPEKVSAYKRKYCASEKGKAVIRRAAKAASAKRKSDPTVIARRIEWESQLRKWADTKVERDRARKKKENARYRLKKKEARKQAILDGVLVLKPRLTDEQKKEAKRVARRNYKDRKRSANGKISKGRISMLLELQKCKCPVCKRNLVLTGRDKYHIDHIIPLAKGGSNHDHNIQLLCKDCNQEKHDILPIEYMNSRGFLL